MGRIFFGRPPRLISDRIEDAKAALVFAGAVAMFVITLSAPYLLR